jgi:Tat protein secretion system quality control protein TatD with DNase activity
MYRCWEKFNSDDKVGFAFGISPSTAVRYGADDTVKELLGSHLDHPKTVAVGLARLDFKGKDDADKRVQIDAVQMMAQLAVERQLPFMLEVREEGGQVAVALLKKICPPDTKIYLHAWGAEPEIAMQLLKTFPNAVVAFTGSATFVKSKSQHELIFDCPMDRLVLGSCAPYSHPNTTPPAGPGQQCHPGLLPHIAAKVAELKNIEAEPVLEAAWNNALKFFFPETPSPPAQTPRGDAGASTVVVERVTTAAVYRISAILRGKTPALLVVEEGAAAAADPAEAAIDPLDADHFPLDADHFPLPPLVDTQVADGAVVGEPGVEADGAAAATVAAEAEAAKPLYLRGPAATGGRGRGKVPGGRGRGKVGQQQALVGRGKERGGGGAGLVVPESLSAADRAKAVSEWQDVPPGGLSSDAAKTGPP